MAQKPRNYDHLFKLLLIGNAGVGKPDIMVLFEQNDKTREVAVDNDSTIRNMRGQAWVADPIQHKTVYTEFVVRTVEIEGQRVKLQVWDTAGQERFKTITSSYYRGASGFLLVYDVRDRKSFEGIHQWLRSMEGNCQKDEAVIVLVGYHNDDPSTKEVSTEEARDFAEQNGMQLFEAASKDAEQVEQIFLAVARKLLQKKQERGEDSSVTEAVTVPDQNTKESKCHIQ